MACSSSPAVDVTTAVLTCRDTLLVIFDKLSVTDLARASCVCKLWNFVAADDEMILRAFKTPWRLRNVVGKPLSRSFWRDNGLHKFAISHQINKGETVASLAVKYSVQVVEIKRLNNMMSDHGIYSRERLLIPINNPNLLVDSTCYIERDTYAKREVAVLYLDGRSDENANCSAFRVTSDEGMRRIITSLRRSMRVDDGTAQYYLSIANGNPRAALSEFSADLSWESQAGAPSG
ncbi:hypothetical protein ACFE04_004660 [Oxalis oulophora]